MKSFFRLSSILFYFLSALVFFFLGVAFTAMIGAGKGQGLAAGAIVLGYGAIAGFLAFIISIFAVGFLQKKYIILLNKILVAVFLLLTVFFAYRYQARQAALNPPGGTRFASVFPVNNAAPLPTPQGGQYGQPMGLGMATPKFYENEVVYLYGNPNLEKSILEHSPMDSLVFQRTELGFEITYAPPWFVPAHLKLDYDMLFLRVMSLHSEFIEVMVNETNGQTAFMDRFKCQLRLWPEFLLSINSVEPLNRVDNPPRIKPLSHASLVTGEYAFLRPLRIADQWMQVELLDDDLKSLAKGWIKWREDGKLLVSYSLLS